MNSVECISFFVFVVDTIFVFIKVFFEVFKCRFLFESINRFRIEKRERGNEILLVWLLFIRAFETVRPVAVSGIEETSFLLEIIRPGIAESRIVQTATCPNLIQGVKSCRSCLQILFIAQLIFVFDIVLFGQEDQRSNGREEAEVRLTIRNVCAMQMKRNSRERQNRHCCRSAYIIVRV